VARQSPQHPENFLHWVYRDRQEDHGKRRQNPQARNTRAVSQVAPVEAGDTQANPISGGNDASIILPDVDIEKTAPEVAMGAFYNSGQVCVATKRIYIHQDIYEPFLKAMIAFTKSIKVGSSDEAGVLVGPIQNEMQYEKVQQFFQDSKKNGYKFAVGTQEVEKSAGYFVQPTIIDNPPNDSRIITEEPFGTSPFPPALPSSSLFQSPRSKLIPTQAPSSPASPGPTKPK